MDAPLTLISYSHDSDSHREAVLNLANALRGRGIDAIIDRYVAAPAQGWPKWMIDQVHAAAFVLTVCTPTYCLRFEGHEDPGRGLGATLEGSLATQIIYEGSMKNQKIIPVLFKGQPANVVPKVLQPYTRYILPDQLDALVRHILNEPEVVAPPVRGRTSAQMKITALPAQRVRSEGIRDIKTQKEPEMAKPATTLATNSLIKKLKLAESALTAAAETAYETSWESMKGWLTKWDPWFAENLTAEEVGRIREAMKKPREPKAELIGKKVITLNDPYGVAVRNLQDVLAGILNKYTP